MTDGYDDEPDQKYFQNNKVIFVFTKLHSESYREKVNKWAITVSIDE